MTDTNCLIEADDLYMHYAIGPREAKVLRDVNLRIAAGTRVAIAGPSGSGKTSLLLLLSGLERPAAGRQRNARLRRTCWLRKQRLATKAGSSPIRIKR